MARKRVRPKRKAKKSVRKNRGRTAQDLHSVMSKKIRDLKQLVRNMSCEITRLNNERHELLGI